MEIRPLDKETYAGRKFTARYMTSGYYDIAASENGFAMQYTPFEAPLERLFDDVFFDEWLEEPVAFGAFEGEKLLGYAEGSPESWNNRFRISNICVFEKAERSRGIGTALMAAIQNAAAASGARMIVLETQTCNETAIAFYKKNGFSIIGLDLYSYSNADPERHEVRLEMGKKLGKEAEMTAEEISMVQIRRAQSGDEETLARIQTESWRAAFAGIVPAELLTQCTSIERAEKMYARLLAEHRGNGYILELDGKAHCIAWWDAAKSEDMPGAAELRCIHSLPDNWRRG